MSAVEWKKLGDLGIFENIGVDKKIVQGEPYVTLLNYVDVYKNKYITGDVPTMRVTAPLKKVTACNVLKGDIFITPTSETKDDIGHTAIALENLDNVVYSYHLMRYRLSQFNMINSYYINYIFDTLNVKEQIYKFANGLTRFGLSKDKFADIVIPIPSLAKQQEIVSHLDTFTSLISNLESELDMRRKQYEHYRNQLLDFEGVEGVEWKTLGEVCTIITGGEVPENTNKGQLEPSKEYPYAVYTNGKEVYGYTNTYQLDVESVCISSIGANTGAVFYRNGKFTPAIRLKVLIPNAYLLAKYLFYISEITDFSGKNTGSVPNINANYVKRIIIPVPSLSTQQEIVSKLDTFENLIQSLEQEIKLRKQQYEYYREKLLTFE